MRILHLTPELPHWPGGTGGATRQFHLLRRLVERGHEVTVVAPVPAGEAGTRERLANAGVRLLGPARPVSRTREALGAIARSPTLPLRAATLPVLAWQVSVFWAELRPVALREIAERHPDIVTIEHDNAAHWIGDLPAGFPAALVLQNVGRHYYESRTRAANGPRAAWFGFEARRFDRHDRRWLARYRRLIAVSERDADDLRRWLDVPVDVVPNGVASDEMAPLQPSADPATLLFTGTLNHPPNEEGIRWFADRIWPTIRAARPETRLLVVGRGAPPSVLELDGRDGIEVVGAVPSMSPYFACATAVVVPLLSGGGTRLKVLEAFACTRALVSTTTGCEGLEVENGRDLLVADRPDAFAEATLRLLDDPSLRGRLAAAGRQLAERRYDWRVLGDELERVLARVAAG